jgi:tellurite methyltransferase
MEIRKWDERYRSGDRSKEDLETAPNPRLVETASKLTPGKALDLACGTGRNAIWLAARGWQVTAVDGVASAMDILHKRAAARHLTVESHVADLEKDGYRIEPDSWDLIAMCFYLQKSLFEAAKRGVRPGGVVLVIVHIAAPGEVPTEHQLRPGELAAYFSDWRIFHSYEGTPNDPPHQRPVAEIVARRPESLSGMRENL